MLSPLSTSPDKIGLRKKSAETGAPAPGVAAPSRFERQVKPGDFLFLEGDAGREMFIIKKGRVKILKTEGAKMVELVTLGPGSVLGEMSLLDNAPRSASAKAIEPLAVTVIDQFHLQQTLKKVPNWITSIIKVVVQRLRETTARNYQDILRNGLAAVLRTLIYLAETRGRWDGDSVLVAMDDLKEEAFHLFGFSNPDTAKVTRFLYLMDLAQVVKAKSGREYLKVKDLEAIELFYQYRKLRWQNKKAPSDMVSPEAGALARILLEAGRTRGFRQGERTALDLKQVLVHLEQLGITPPIVDEEQMKELEDGGFIRVERKAGQMAHSGAAFTRQVFSFGRRELPALVKELEHRRVFDTDITAALT